MKRLRRSASASVLESIKALIYLFFTFNCSIYMLFGHLRFAGSWKEQRWKIKAFPMEELWWFEWILLVLSSPFFFFFYTVLLYFVLIFILIHQRKIVGRWTVFGWVGQCVLMLISFVCLQNSLTLAKMRYA